MIWRSIVVWLLIIVETIHGIARVLLLQRHVGDFRARQIGVFTGSILIFLIVLACIRLIGARRVSQLLGIGCLWVVLTLLFEIGLGRFVMGYSWDRIIADYDIFTAAFLRLV